MRASFLGALALLLVACNSDTVPTDPQAPLGDLLPITEELHLPGLEGPVDAVRDQSGRMHIYATSLHDAMQVQGYLIARDRHVQLDFFRRVSSGRLTEALGTLDPSLVETDISFRHLGFRRVAEVMYAEADAETRAFLDAYAAGVSQAFAEIQSGQRALPEAIKFIEPQHLTPWTGVDSLAIGRLQSWLLSYDDDTPTQALLDDLRGTFKATDPDPAVAARAGMERDYMRLEPPDPATTIDSIDDIGDGGLRSKRHQRPETHARRPVRSAQAATRALRQKLFAATERHRAALERGRAVFAPTDDFGSNNWAVSGERTATGRAMLASDPHLSLSSPSVFWPVALHVEHKPVAGATEAPPEDLHVNGLAFAGIPGIILGHNEHVAWGATVTGYDVTDVYAEELTPDGDAVLYQGQPVPLETVEERIGLPDGEELVYNVKIVPHHGPIMPTIVDGEVVDPNPEVGAISVRWTGFEPTQEFRAVFGLMTAKNVDEARAALELFEVGAQNWMLADTDGNILWTSHARVPYRDAAALSWDAQSYTGLLPCLLLPGDGSAEWTSDWADDSVPWSKNPQQGFLATANQDQVGGTLDNDPSNDVQRDGQSAFLACTFDHGFRQGRIRTRILENPRPIELDDMSSIQGDHRSPLGARLTPALLLAIDNAEAQRQSLGSYPDLVAVVTDPAYDPALVAQVRGLLGAWASFDYAAASGVNPDDGTPLPSSEPEAQAAQAALVFNIWAVRFLGRVFGDELSRIGRAGGTGQYESAILHLLESEPQSLATYDAASGDSILWDDIDTTEVVESRQERMIRALLDAFRWLTDNVGPIDSWRWGALHTLRMETIIPVPMAIPSVSDENFSRGFPRHGDMHNVDASNFDLRASLDDDDLSLGYDSGPTQRFVVELDPAGLKVRNAIPGGAVWDKQSPHFADQAELWRRNQVAPVAFYLEQVLATAETRTLVTPP